MSQEAFGTRTVAMKKYRNSPSKTIAWALFFLCALSSPGTSAHAAQSDSEAIAQRWVQRLAATMEEHASPADVDRLLEMYANDAVYEHPHAGARVEGKALLREGILSHLGETRAPKIQITQTIAGESFAIIELTVKLDIHQDAQWVAAERRQVVVLELKDSRIQRIIDHWGH
jgi:ketosteroid isomerase-like protein